ncbi:MAG TPA: carboxypeptidase-like regulatory domain-containing protein, partial [Vicinamibacterales bacterium]|nr:carboxypeptidase-like regulatory domain-containing protein [Vicinamibacterales bacterium]
MRVTLAVVVVAAMVVSAAAQTDTGEISGVIRDTQGGVLPGVIVVAEQRESGTRIERVTDGEGRYFLPSLRTGTYTI